jgi:hypothetical protein
MEGKKFRWRWANVLFASVAARARGCARADRVINLAQFRRSIPGFHDET